MIDDDALGTALAALEVVRDVPQVVLYALATPFLFFGGLAAPFAVVVSQFGLGSVPLLAAIPVALLLSSLLAAVLQIAICHAVDAAFEGRRPTPGSGLVVAATRPRRVLGGVVLAVVAFHAQRYLTDLGPLGDAVAEAGQTGVQVATLLALPIVATTDGSLSDTIREVMRAIDAHGEAGLAVTFGTRAIAIACFWGALVTAVGLGGLAVFGVGLSLPPLGRFTLPLSVGLVGAYVAVASATLVRAVLATALFRWIEQGDFPVATDPEDVFERPAGTRHGATPP